MAEFEEKLNSILSDPAAMERIAALAQTLSKPEDRPSKQPEDSPPASSEASASPPSSGEGAGLSALLGALDGSLGDLDPQLIQTILGLMSGYGANDDRRVALLTALKPFLKLERQAKVERAIQIARLSRMIRAALRLFKKDSGEEDAHV